jgi:hypothetical protein
MLSGFGGLVVSALSSGSQVRGFKHGRSHRSHVAALWHVKMLTITVEVAIVS